ncbi:hypothetical protein DL796_07140 [Kangiella spongicola]|uniref:DUF2178 domain-containing protein n=2 Tax=Kangiella spongicola TaxID=796379 RepID=A0A318D322_9GAMM|nr:hypothetical protein DL796_07140 [Kangiella spongicola]
MELNKVDKLVQSRAKILIFAAFAFALWQFSWIGADIVKDTESSFIHIITGLVILGSILWVIACYFFYVFSKKVKKANALQALNDELTHKNKLQAFMAGYFILFGMIWLVIPATDFWDFDLILIIRAIAVLAIVIPILIFSYLEFKNDQGAE